MNNEEYRIHALIRQEADFLIDCSEKLNPWLKKIITRANKHKKHERDTFGQSQIRQLIQATRQASGLKELTLFIRYQMGRDERKQNWNSEIQNKTLGDAVIEQLNNISLRVKSLLTTEDSLEFERQLFLRMVERFFYYWSWQYKYLLTNTEKQEHSGRAVR